MVKSPTGITQAIDREINIAISRLSLWEFCKVVSPDFYQDDRVHLKELCETLQALYEGRIQKESNGDKWVIYKKRYEDLISCKKLMINVPPQHGKSRTLINFSCWVFGKNPSEKIITASYNDLTASDFSRYTRDGITATKNDDFDIVYSDIFPDTKIKKGNAGHEKWALEGQHFSYMGSGIGGSLTSKGGSILIVDDPIKGAEEAFNINLLDKIWLWYTSTFLSRVSAKGGEPIEIVNHTRWSEKDVCGRILEDEKNKNDWYILKMEAYYHETDKMLCDQIFSKKRYSYLSSIMDEAIFRANYHQEPFEKKGLMYESFKTYSELPSGIRKNYTDTADDGSDYLCSIFYSEVRVDKEYCAYITDIVYTQEPMEKTEQKVVNATVANNTTYLKIESNNGGKGFARNIKRILKDEEKYNCNIVWFHQSANKESRIYANSHDVCRKIYFPEGWKERWPVFYQHIKSHKREGKNAHDDAADALTGVCEDLGKNRTIYH